MNAIMGMLSILGDTSLTKEQKECTDTMSENSSALLSLLNTLLDFSKIESEHLELEVTLRENHFPAKSFQTEKTTKFSFFCCFLFL